MRSRKVAAVCIFNELQAAGLLLALNWTAPARGPCGLSDTDHQIWENIVMLLNTIGTYTRYIINDFIFCVCSAA